MRADVVSGAVFPDYELSDHRGRTATRSARGAAALPPRLGHQQRRAASRLGEGRQDGFHPYGKTQAQVFAEQVEP